MRREVLLGLADVLADHLAEVDAVEVERELAGQHLGRQRLAGAATGPANSAADAEAARAARAPAPVLVDLPGDRGRCAAMSRSCAVCSAGSTRSSQRGARSRSAAARPSSRRRPCSRAACQSRAEQLVGRDGRAVQATRRPPRRCRCGRARTARRAGRAAGPSASARGPIAARHSARRSSRSGVAQLEPQPRPALGQRRVDGRDRHRPADRVGEPSRAPGRAASRRRTRSGAPRPTARARGRERSPAPRARAQPLGRSPASSA